MASSSKIDDLRKQREARAARLEKPQKVVVGDTVVKDRHGPVPRPATKEEKDAGKAVALLSNCDHKFVDSKTCIKCGVHIDALRAALLAAVDE